MSVARTARRRRKQHANGFAHLALHCGKNVRGGRPVYRKRALMSVQEAIAAERHRALKEQKMKAKGRKK